MRPRQFKHGTVASPVTDLARRAYPELEKAGYALVTKARYRRLWRKLAAFAGSEEFSEDLVGRFMESLSVQKTIRGKKVKCVPNDKLKIMGLNVLRRYHQQGFIRFNQKTDLFVLPKQLETLLQAYETYHLRQRRCSAETIRLKVSHARRLLVFLYATDKANCLNEINAGQVADYLKSLSYLKPCSLSAVVSGDRAFLRYLWLQEHIQQDLSVSLPQIRVPHDSHIPYVLGDQEIGSILSGIERSSPKGKRDYAMILMAVRLGLRAGDIRMLKLDSLKWEESRIDLVQGKTKTSLELPLSPEVGEALIDYLEHGRPRTSHREVFLTVCPPFRPLTSQGTVGSLIAKYRCKALLPSPPSGRGGAHALRHTMATRLLKCGIPLETISSVLGHRSMDSTRIYTKVDIPALQKVALNPDHVFGEETSHA